MVHVVLAPPKTLREDLLKKVAFLVGKEIVDTRLRLAGKIPRIIASYSNADTADSIAQRLRDAGLVAFVSRDSELRNSTTGFMAYTMRAGEKEVIFRDRRDGEVKVEAAGAFLVIRGRIPSAPQTKTQTTKMKLNISATILAGGIPIMRRVAEKTAQESFQAEGFVRIYDRTSSDPRVEMSQNHIDYSLLGPELTPSTPANFDLVLAKLRKWLPLAIFDDLLIRSFEADVPVAGPAEALEINCKLIYMCHLVIEGRGAPMIGR